MATVEEKKEILDWLKSTDQDRNIGLALWGKHGKNRALDRLFYRSGDFAFQKLKYELGKIAGLTFADFKDGDIIVDANPLAVMTLIPGKEGEVPSIVLRIQDDIFSLFAQLTALNKELVDLPESNDEETVERAAELGVQIDGLNARYDELYQAKEKYFTDKVMPDEKELYPVVDDTDPFGLKGLDGAKLMGEKKNLESSLTKDRNRLLYQQTKKKKEENPMPEGEERKAVETRVALKEAKLEAINELLNAGKSE